MKKGNITGFILLFFMTFLFFGEARALTPEALESIEKQTQEMSKQGVPEARIRRMLTLMAQKRFNKHNQIRAQQIVIETVRAGVPTEPVMNKAIEGLAKQAGEQEIIAAMEAVKNRHTYANRLAGPLSKNKKNIRTMTRLIADSLAAGMKSMNMETVMAQLKTQTHQQTKNKAGSDNLAIQTLQTVRSMARLGIPPGDVTKTLCKALQNQYTHQEIEQLHDQIVKQFQRQSFQEIAGQYAKSIGKSDDSSGSGSGGGGAGSGGGGAGSGGGGAGSGGGGAGSGGGGSGSGSGN